MIAVAAPLRAEQRYYVSDINLAPELLPPPPDRGSPEQATDLAEVIAVSQARTKTETALALSEQHFFIFSFTPAIGAFFQSNNLPWTTAFFRNVERETDRVIDTGKAIWKRPRSFEVDTNLFCGLPEKPLTSHPSGHSTRGTVYALLLAELFPDRRDAILAVGRQIGWHRVLIGMHYPTDIYAGRVLGQAIVRQMKSNRAFRRDFNRAKAEVSAWCCVTTETR